MSLHEAIMGCPSFERHRKTAEWVLDPCDHKNMPRGLVRLLGDARASGVSEDDQRALCVAYGCWPRTRTVGHAERGGVKQCPVKTIVSAIERGSVDWTSVSIPNLPHEVVVDSVNAVCAAYASNSMRAKAVEKNLWNWSHEKEKNFLS